jgi:ABC-2 type transport system permease protein
MFFRFEQIADLFFWPSIDIFLWGMTFLWIQNSGKEVPHLALVILSGLTYWLIVWRSSYEVGVGLLLEFWNRNLVNLFSTPLRLRDWIGGILLISLGKSLLVILFAALLSYVLYALNVFTVGWAFLPFMFSLFLTGWWSGFFVSGIVVYYGQRLQVVAWMLAYLFAPFSAVYYPVSALPSWGQAVAKALPTSYVFEGLRQILSGGAFPYQHLWMALGLNVLYLSATLTFFSFMFEKSRTKGLARLE